MQRKPTDLISETMLEDALRAGIKEALNSLTKTLLWRAFLLGKSDYLFGNVSSSSAELAFKDVLTGFSSLLFRSVKSYTRLPNEEDITDDNAKEILKNFLSGPGDKNLASLKYKVILMLLEIFKHQLLSQKKEIHNVAQVELTIFSEKRAARLVEMVLEELGCKQNNVSSLSEKDKTSLEQTKKLIDLKL